MIIYRINKKEKKPVVGRVYTDELCGLEAATSNKLNMNRWADSRYYSVKIVGPQILPDRYAAIQILEELNSIDYINGLYDI